MTEGSRHTVSLKTKLLVLVGGTVALLLVLIFVAVALAWRTLVISNLREDALSVTRAFAVSVLETLIYSENGYAQREDQLDKSIEQFIRQERRVREITIFDTRGKVISGSNLAEREYRPHPRGPATLAGVTGPVTTVHGDHERRWVVETLMPLKTGDKGWGFLEMTLDAAPAQRRVVALFWGLALSLALATSGVMLVLNFQVRRATGSLTALAKAMDRLDLDSEGAIDLPMTNDELGTVIRHFDLLKDRLVQSRQQLVEAQRQIYQAEKLASIGRLASGVAHEVNNPLNGIRHCVFAIQQEPENREQTAEYLGLIGEGLDHIDQVVQKLLRFAHKPSQNPIPTDVNAGIRSVLALLGYRLKQHQVDVRLELDPRLPLVLADPQLLQEVFMNLLLNGFDAVTEGGRVVVQTASEDVTGVRVSVTDDGVGIDVADLGRIFDPFFTTKEPGKGTGLGLSVAQSITEALGGTISVESQKGKGSRFTLRLPVRGRI
jgi:two-component system, NtrC family, sensor kinase